MVGDNAVLDAPSVDRARPSTREPAVRDLSWLDRAKFALVRGFLWAWARAFSLKGLYLFGQVFGFLEWLINYKRRRRFRENLRLVFGDDRRYWPESVHRACLRHFMRLRCDKLFYLIFDKLPREKILNRIRFENREIFEEALRQNRGVYVCMSHHGSHHVLILLMALMGYKVAGVRDRNEGALRRYVQQKYEETFPEFRDIRMFFADSYPRDIYRCFQDGYILGSALDVARDRGSHLRTAKVMLFGQEREFLTGPLQIALRVGAPIIQGFVVSRKNFYFKLIAKGPLVEPGAAGDEAEIVQRAMQKYADNIAEHIREYPDHISRT